MTLLGEMMNLKLTNNALERELNDLRSYLLAHGISRAAVKMLRDEVSRLHNKLDSIETAARLYREMRIK